MAKLKTTVKKTFPGYVLVELIMTDESWYVVRNTPGVTGFVGSAGAGSKPNPLLPEEVRFILKQMGLKERLSMLNSKLASKFVLNQVHLRIKLVKFKKLKQISLN
ncbi:Transcription antitermination protein NusG [Staphylococcus aureus]|uniref:Transcription antitermination protein NusG n=1 Tax=Staphylococcus aureus TaxID=1280 RepID=A0A2X2K0G2_STAAU|nr:Transcription antitermination protein NusG [Staphylococcus aureus]